MSPQLSLVNTKEEKTAFLECSCHSACSCSMEPGPRSSTLNHQKGHRHTQAVPGFSAELLLFFFTSCF